MAKRYVPFKDLSEGKFKPENTMGRHYCTIVSQNERKVVVGSVTGRVTLKPGDTLGYDRGNVWVVPCPEYYKDPIRRVLAQAHLSQKLLKYSAKPVKYLEEWQDTSNWPKGSSADSFTGEEVTVFRESSLNRGEKIRLFDDGGLYQVTGGEAIIVEKVVGRETTTHRPRRVTQIIVRPTANKAAVAEWLGENLSHKVRIHI